MWTDQRSGLNNRRLCVFFDLFLAQHSYTLRGNLLGRQAFDGEPGRVRLNPSAALTSGWQIDLILARDSELDPFSFCMFYSRRPHRYADDELSHLNDAYTWGRK